MHWWIFDQGDPEHYQPAGTVEVRIDGKHDTHHKIGPTEVQRALAAAGTVVCWATGHKLLIPYGGRPFVYQPREGEDWSGEMASWARDWRISRPRPAEGAAWWGLVPMPPSGLAAYADFRRTAAINVMAALARSEHGREHHRRKLAREHAQRLAATQSAITPPAPRPTPDPLPKRPRPPQPQSRRGLPHPITPACQRLGRRRLFPRRWLR